MRYSGEAPQLVSEGQARIGARSLASQTPYTLQKDTFIRGSIESDHNVRVLHFISLKYGEVLPQKGYYFIYFKLIFEFRKVKKYDICCGNT